MPHILIAEDDATTREMIRGILKKEGYDVSTAADGMAALRILRKRILTWCCWISGCPR